MEAVAAAVTGLTRIAFVLVGAAAVRRWWVERSRSSAALAVALGLLAFVLVVGWGARVVEVEGWVLDLLIAATFAGSGYAVLEHRATVLPVSPRWRLAAGAALTVGVIAYVITSAAGATAAAATARLVAADVLLGTYLVIVGEPALRLWSHASEVPIVRRVRLRLLSLAYASIAIVLLAVTAASGSRDTDSGTALVANLVGLALVPVLYLAVSPPTWARSWWLQRQARREAFAVLPVASWYVDIETGDLWWSSTLRNLLGVDEDAPASWDLFFRHVHPDDRDRLARRSDDGLLSPSPAGMDFRLVRPDGEIRHVNGRGKTLTEPSGPVSAVFGVLQDVTDRQRAQHEVEEALERQREAAEQLRELDRMKNSFLAAVSHELRTPLTVVSGLAQTLNDRPEDLSREQQRVIVERLIANADRLGVLLEDLLDINRFLRGDLEVDRQDVDLAARIRSMVADVAEDEHPLEVVAPSTLWATVDPVRFERILDNLVRNAAAHTPAGTRIWVELVRESDGAVVLTVSDDGPGIPDRDKQRLLRPFERGPGRHAQGTGLGLAIVSEFAQAHGGTARIDDRPGGGTAVDVRFPPPTNPVESDTPALSVTPP